MALESEDRKTPFLSRDNKLSSSADLRHKAWVDRDIESSKEVHRQMLGSTVPLSSKIHLQRNAQNSSDYLRVIVFGGLDGIATIFATVAGCIGAQLTPYQTLIVGCGNLLANAISMGFSEYLSSSAEDDFLESERAREEWEVMHCPEEEKREMIEIYEHRYGFSKADAVNVIETSFKYKSFFICHMMAEELGLLLPQDKDNTSASTPLSRGVAMFASFVVLGLVPLLAFLLAEMHSFHLLPRTAAAYLSVTGIASCVTLFFLGMLKSRFTSQHPTRSGLAMTLNGSIAGAVAFGIGHTLQKIIGGASVLE